MSANLQFDPIRLPAECEALRNDVRAFLAEEIAAGTFDPHRPGHGDSHNRAFSRRIGAKGWIGMTWPKKYGGQRAQLPRALRGDGRIPRRQRAGAAAFRRRPAERAGAAQIRARAREGRHPAAHLPRRTVLRHRHERARLRLRPVRGQDQGDQGRRRLEDQRLQDLDQQRAYRRLHARPVPHLAAHQGEPPPRPHAIPGRHEGAGHHREPGHPDDRPARLQRGGVRGRLRARRSRDGRDRRRLEAGDQRARL